MPRKILGIIVLAGLPLLFAACSTSALTHSEVSKLRTVFVSQEVSDDATCVYFFSTAEIKNTGAVSCYCNALKNSLRSDGYDVTEDRAKADCIIQVQAPPSIFRSKPSVSDRAIAITPHCGLVAFLPRLSIRVSVSLRLTVQEQGTGKVLSSADEMFESEALNERFHSMSTPKWEALTDDQRQSVLSCLSDGLAGISSGSLNDLGLLVLRRMPETPNPKPAPVGSIP
jgi:hypothetical protein